ncbi:GAF domain-containing protein [Paraburkholderia sp. DGU8]|uniref:aspartate racemase/maleate isomerase family protein n=1 Tax=Paraburkholderia sp. DGU8 TaxID=3161997 RepID=UPI0034676C35
MESSLKKLESFKALKKVGFITPSSNTALELLTTQMTHPISDRVSTHFSRVPVKTLTLDTRDVDQFQTQRMADAGALLKDGGMNAMLWGGTSGSWTGKGFRADLTLCDEIGRVTGVPASTASLAQVEVLKRYGIKHFGLAVPYFEAPTRNIIDAYGAEGFTAVKSARLDETESIRVADVPFERIKQLLREADSSQAECIVVAGTNLPATVVVDEMEAELGKPIFDSIGVMLWKALQMTGINVPLHGWGKLLRDNPVLTALEQTMATLLQATGASRTTVRIDIPAHNCHLDTVCAEAMAPGIVPLKLNSSMNQRSLPTVKWLEANRDLLIQSDCENHAVKPPKALTAVYGVKAQMLAPLMAQDELFGFVSLHYVPSTRVWSEGEIATLRSAATQVNRILAEHGWAG